MGLRGLRHKNKTGAIISALMNRIPSELRSSVFLGESSTRMGDLLGKSSCCTPLFGSFWVLRGTISTYHLSSQWLRPSPSPSAQDDRRSGHPIVRYGPSKSRVWDFSPFLSAWKIPSFQDDRRKRQAFWMVEVKAMGENAW